MQATADLQIIPMGNGVSVRAEISRVVEILRAQGFVVKSHAAGTNIEGDLQQIMLTIEQLHEQLHQWGVVRVLSNIKLETRTDKLPTLAGKKLE